ncbi:hypothetical protein EXIGLDRAFT_828699 [Exidia glandulosa HHB12029]|uniref:SP-RING-type domain-containing protein n=1 Tax=Exidia glandulosa HHB12029 TaxID=1314781 RepID=A0A165QAY7_EXIGL|nr:hypothetical protein EXIGLDRAFT_828699 [Exidia glandulosa HHB12029]
MSSRRSVTAPRRGRRNAVASDDEEGDVQAADNTVDASEGDAEPRRSQKKGKPSKRAPSRRAGSDDEDDEEDLPEIDVNNFSDQPLQKDAAIKLKGAISDWGMVDNLLHRKERNPFDVVVAAAEAVTEYGDDQAEPILSQLDGVMRELIDASVQLDLQREVLQGLKNRIEINEEIDDVIDQWEKGVKQLNTKYLQKTSRQKYGKNDRYNGFKEAIWNIQHEQDKEAMPPLSTFIEKEDGDVDDSDDEVEVGGVTQDFNDILTMTIISDPVTSRVCKHSFSKASMDEFLRAGPKKCPHLGCAAMVSRGDLQPDPELERKIRAFQRREKRRNAEDSDAEEIDDDDVVE